MAKVLALCCYYYFQLQLILYDTLKDVDLSDLC